MHCKQSFIFIQLGNFHQIMIAVTPDLQCMLGISLQLVQAACCLVCKISIPTDKILLRKSQWHILLSSFKVCGFNLNVYFMIQNVDGLSTHQAFY